MSRNNLSVHKFMKPFQLIREIKILRNKGGFDSEWYLQTYPDVAQSNLSPLLHYLVYGSKQGKNPNDQFDTCWYLQQYPDVAASGMNPFVHYL